MKVESLWREPERDAVELDWPALQFHDVFKIYRSGPVETVALRGLELRVDRSEFIAVLGQASGDFGVGGDDEAVVADRPRAHLGRRGADAAAEQVVQLQPGPGREQRAVDARLRAHDEPIRVAERVDELLARPADARDDLDARLAQHRETRFGEGLGDDDARMGRAARHDRA